VRDRKAGQKGSYSDVRLPVASRYVVPHSRRGMLLIGGVAVALLVATFLVDRYFFDGGLLSNGPLAASHAGFESECGSCHSDATREVTVEKCSLCHEKYGDELGVYSFGAHYVYRSDDFRRLVPSEHERPCYACHLEHEGRDAAITAVGDVQCLVCHEFGSFDDGHPQFDFAAEAIPDDGALAFSHAHHVRELMKQEGVEDLERTCLYCHNAQADGRDFDPIDFDRHCDACHLKATIATPALPIRGTGGEPGVETLETIVARRGPETRWALYTNPNEFRRRGSVVSKAPVYHRDPWILHNLRQLRGLLYPDAGLADLLTASPDVQASDYRRLYEEAIATLEERALGLRGRPEPEVQDDLVRIEDVLGRLRREIEEPFAPLDETKFQLAFDAPNPALDAAQVAAIEAVVADLTQPCRQCHTVRKATIARVQKDQRALRRAEFNHRAHILQTRCLDCHAEIPIAQLARTTGDIDPAIDNAKIQNLPRIETCRRCHTARLGTNECVTCHDFHPNKDRRSDLLLYLE
jgi:Cytochrome c7 and related cytochrome c